MIGGERSINRDAIDVGTGARNRLRGIAPFELDLRRSRAARGLSSPQSAMPAEITAIAGKSQQYG
jgi:hypothetical protein